MGRAPQAAVRAPDPDLGPDCRRHARPAERQRVFDAVWETGGFRFIFESFDDLISNQSIDDEASEFVRNKIRTIVKDSETAELLCRTGHPFGTKRLPLGHFYYETFNRADVDLVGLRDNPIARITPRGTMLEDGTDHEVDVIVFALGFNAMTGALAAIDVRGRGGRKLDDKWAGGASTYLGVAVDEFPNVFVILGPQSPFVNTPPMVERQVDFIGGAIRYMREHEVAAIEATSDAVESWNAECHSGLNETLIPKGLDDRPWFLRRIPGKPLNVLFYFGGFEATADNVQAHSTTISPASSSLRPPARSPQAEAARAGRPAQPVPRARRSAPIRAATIRFELAASGTNTSEAWKQPGVTWRSVGTPARSRRCA